jgi:hypothetical protein
MPLLSAPDLESSFGLGEGWSAKLRLDLLWFFLRGSANVVVPSGKTTSLPHHDSGLCSRGDRQPKCYDTALDLTGLSLPLRIIV